MFHFTGVRTVRTGDPMLRYAHEELTIYFIFKTHIASSSFKITHPPQNRNIKFTFVLKMHSQIQLFFI